VAQSDSSDLDIWVCHGSELNQEQRLLLRQKCDAISQWAESIGLEAHCFLMDADRFRAGEREGLSTEDCGSSQHYLLLDEFYRTSVLIAGRTPIWWLVPPEEEPHYDYYANTLRDKRFVRADDTIDFGSVGRIPAGEFVGAGIWQLYKGIDSPYKSALKILLTEVYAHEYPDIEPLSTTFKRAIYQDRLDIDELDPYMVVFRKLEHYLESRNEPQRLALIRRCFYFKVGKALTRPLTSPTKSWQRQLLEKLVRQWQWSESQLSELDSRSRWKVGQVITEQQDLVRELTNSYRFLLEFARRTQATALINSQEMAVLGRKLYAAFERKAGKIEWINPGISNNLSEDALTFYQYQNPTSGKQAWAVSAVSSPAIASDKLGPLKQADELITLLAWCHCNGILTRSSQFAIVAGDHGVKEYELQRIIRALQQSLPSARQYTASDDHQHQHFTQAAKPAELQLFINIGTDPLAQLRNQGIERLSDRTDSLAYSGLGENLVVNIEQVLVNSWGEVSSRRYDGDYALVRCLRDYLQMLPPQTKPSLPSLHIHCFCPTRAHAIVQRMEELFQDVAACYYSGTRPPCSRYIMEVERQYYVLQFIEQHARIECVGNFPALMQHLQQAQSQYSPLVVDRYCNRHSQLRAISQQVRADSIQVFYQRRASVADVYVSDERGSLSHLQLAAYDDHSYLLALDQFIQSTLFRQRGEQFDDVSGLLPVNAMEVEYYELSDSGGSYQALRRDPLARHGRGSFFNVQALADNDGQGKMTFNIYCDQQGFTELELGAELYNEVARFILSRRHSGERYPCHITDLDLSRCSELLANGSLQTSHYLHYKNKLEQALNQALTEL
jgi:adenylate cyclase class 1